MSFLGVGGVEFLLILLLVVIVLGPERAREAGAAAGRLIRRMTTSEFWRELVQAARFMQQLPQNLVKMAELEEMQTRLTRDVQDIQNQVQQVTKPLESLNPARAMQESIRAAQEEVKQAVSLTPPAVQPAQAEPSAPAPVQPAPPPAKPSAVPPPAVKPGDQELLRMVQDLARYAEEWPATVERLAALERSQAQLAVQLETMESIVEWLRGAPSDDEQA